MASFESIFGALGTSQPSLTGSAEAETPGVGVSWSFGAQERDGVQSQTPSMAEEDGQGRYVLPHEEYLSDGHVEARLDEDFPLKPRTEPGAHGDEGDCGSECNSDVEQNNSEYEGDDDAEEDSVSEDEPNDPSVQYNLRTTVRAVPTVFDSTWLDADESGNYNPLMENRRHPMKKAPKRKLYSTIDSDSDTNRRPAKQIKRDTFVSLEQARREGLALIVTFKLPPEKSQELKAAESEDNWPYEASSNALLDDDLQIREQVPAEANAPETARTLTRLVRSRHQRTQHGASPSADNTSDENLIGHPAARGCKSCHEIGIRCPLLDPDKSWPCSTCRNDGVDCQLRLTPRRKRNCESCKRARRTCSFAVDDTNAGHLGPCKECTKRNIICCAGPAFDPTRARMLPDGTPARVESGSVSKKPKTVRSCAACRDAKKRCSLLALGAGDSKPPKCKRCDQNGIDCKIDQVLRKKKTKRPSQENLPVVIEEPKTPRQYSEPEAAAPPSPRAPARPKPTNASHSNERPSNGILKVITSRYSHPIKFMAENQETCLWCTQPAIAAMGLPPRKTKVIDLPNGAGYQEIEGGWHSELGVAASQMCRACTFFRLKIMICAGHSLQPLGKDARISTTGQGREMDSANLTPLLDRLRPLVTEKNIPAIHQEMQTWCTICPRPATHQCCTTTAATAHYPAHTRGMPGCGLRVCDSCRSLLQRTAGGSLNAVFKNASALTRGAGYAHGHRADLSFLTGDGLLVKAIRRGRSA